jgi:hypothetical protein
MLPYRQCNVGCCVQLNLQSIIEKKNLKQHQQLDPGICDAHADLGSGNLFGPGSLVRDGENSDPG